MDNFLSYVKQKDKKDRNQGNTDFVHKKKLMHRKLSTGVYNFGEKYEKSMVLACSRIYVLYIIYMKVKRDSQGLVFVKWTETTFW